MAFRITGGRADRSQVKDPCPAGYQDQISGLGGGQRHVRGVWRGIYEGEGSTASSGRLERMRQPG
jgi:hypothetical protein